METDILRVVWSSSSGESVASLVGPIDEDSVDVLVAIGVLAKSVVRVVVDLSCVTAVREGSIELLEHLSGVPNVAMVNLSAAVVDALGTAAGSASSQPEVGIGRIGLGDA